MQANEIMEAKNARLTDGSRTCSDGLWQNGLVPVPTHERTSSDALSDRRASAPDELSRPSSMVSGCGGSRG